MKIIFTMSILSLCWWRKNIIMMLLSLELLLISTFTMLSILNPSASMSLLTLLAFLASASSLGLSLLVSISNSHNSSNSYPINLLSSDKNNSS